MRLSLLLAALAVLAPTAARAQLRLPLLYSDGAVLQRDAEVPVWGWAAPGAAVEVTFDGAMRETRAADDGRWRVALPQHAAGGPFELAVRAGARPLMLGWVVPTWASFDVLRWQRALGEAAAARDAVLRPLLVSGWSDPALLAMARRADGLVVYPGEWGPLPDAVAAATRLVVVDRASGHAAVPSLVANPPATVDALCAALASWGRRRIAWIGRTDGGPVIAARRARWLACAAGPELPSDRAAIAEALRTHACDALLGAALPDALLALRAARDVGARVPEDVAVAVVNDEGLGDSLVPALCAPRCPDLAAWLGGALGWLAGEKWQPAATPITIERRETV